MPVYTSHCKTCDNHIEYVRTISNRNDTPECCGTSSNKVLDTPMVSAMAFSGHKGFMLPTAENAGAGTWIESGADFKRYIRENNIIVGDECKQEQTYQRERRIVREREQRRSQVTEVVNRAFGSNA